MPLIYFADPHAYGPDNHHPNTLQATLKGSLEIPANSADKTYYAVWLEQTPEDIVAPFDQIASKIIAIIRPYYKTVTLLKDYPDKREIAQAIISQPGIKDMLPSFIPVDRITLTFTENYVVFTSTSSPTNGIEKFTSCEPLQNFRSESSTAVVSRVQHSDKPTHAPVAAPGIDCDPTPVHSASQPLTGGGTDDLSMLSFSADGDAGTPEEALFEDDAITQYYIFNVTADFDSKTPILNPTELARRYQLVAIHDSPESLLTAPIPETKDSPTLPQIPYLAPQDSEAKSFIQLAQAYATAMITPQALNPAPLMQEEDDDEGFTPLEESLSTQRSLPRPTFSTDTESTAKPHADSKITPLYRFASAATFAKTTDPQTKVLIAATKSDSGNNPAKYLYNQILTAIFLGQEDTLPKNLTLVYPALHQGIYSAQVLAFKGLNKARLKAVAQIIRLHLHSPIRQERGLSPDAFDPKDRFDQDVLDGKVFPNIATLFGQCTLHVLEADETSSVKNILSGSWVKILPIEAIKTDAAKPKLSANPADKQEDDPDLEDGPLDSILVDPTPAAAADRSSSEPYLMVTAVQNHSARIELTQENSLQHAVLSALDLALFGITEMPRDLANMDVDALREFAYFLQTGEKPAALFKADFFAFLDREHIPLSAKKLVQALSAIETKTPNLVASKPVVEHGPGRNSIETANQHTTALIQSAKQKLEKYNATLERKQAIQEAMIQIQQRVEEIIAAPAPEPQAQAAAAPEQQAQAAAAPEQQAQAAAAPEQQALEQLQKNQGLLEAQLQAVEQELQSLESLRTKQGRLERQLGDIEHRLKSHSDELPRVYTLEETFQGSPLGILIDVKSVPSGADAIAIARKACAIIHRVLQSHILALKQKDSSFELQTAKKYLKLGLLEAVNRYLEDEIPNTQIAFGAYGIFQQEGQEEYQILCMRIGDVALFSHTEDSLTNLLGPIVTTANHEAMHLPDNSLAGNIKYAGDFKFATVCGVAANQTIKIYPADTWKNIDNVHLDDSYDFFGGQYTLHGFKSDAAAVEALVDHLDTNLKNECAHSRQHSLEQVADQVQQMPSLSLAQTSERLITTLSRLIIELQIIKSTAANAEPVPADADKPSYDTLRALTDNNPAWHIPATNLTEEIYTSCIAEQPSLEWLHIAAKLTNTKEDPDAEHTLAEEFYSELATINLQKQMAAVQALQAQHAAAVQELQAPQAAAVQELQAPQAAAAQALQAEDTFISPDLALTPAEIKQTAEVFLGQDDGARFKALLKSSTLAEICEAISGSALWDNFYASVLERLQLGPKQISHLLDKQKQLQETLNTAFSALKPLSTPKFRQTLIQAIESLTGAVVNGKMRDAFLRDNKSPQPSVSAEYSTSRSGEDNTTEDKTDDSGEYDDIQGVQASGGKADAGSRKGEMAEEESEEAEEEAQASHTTPLVQLPLAADTHFIALITALQQILLQAMPRPFNLRRETTHLSQAVASTPYHPTSSDAIPSTLLPLCRLGIFNTQPYFLQNLCRKLTTAVYKNNRSRALDYLNTLGNVLFNLTCMYGLHDKYDLNLNDYKDQFGVGFIVYLLENKILRDEIFIRANIQQGLKITLLTILEEQIPGRKGYFQLQTVLDTNKDRVHTLREWLLSLSEQVKKPPALSEIKTDSVQPGETMRFVEVDSDETHHTNPATQ